MGNFGSSASPQESTRSSGSGASRSTPTASSHRTSLAQRLANQWNDGRVNQQIADKKLAPRFPSDTGAEECPICFLNYDDVNTTLCCNAIICTECWVEIKRAATVASTSSESHSSACPFCGIDTFEVKFEDSAARSPRPAQSKANSEPKKTVYVPTSSKEDRLELEQQMKSLRMKYDEKRLPGASSSTYSSSSGRSGLVTAMRSVRSQLGHSMPGRESARDSGSNLAQLEEMMMMEAIRQSEIEASAATLKLSSSKPDAIVKANLSPAEKGSPHISAQDSSTYGAKEVLGGAETLTVKASLTAAPNQDTIRSGAGEGGHIPVACSAPSSRSEFDPLPPAAESDEELTEEEMLQMAMMLSMTGKEQAESARCQSPPRPPTDHDSGDY